MRGEVHTYPPGGFRLGEVAQDYAFGASSDSDVFAARAKQFGDAARKAYAAKLAGDAVAAEQAKKEATALLSQLLPSQKSLAVQSLNAEMPSDFMLWFSKAGDSLRTLMGNIGLYVAVGAVLYVAFTNRGGRREW